MRFTHLIFSFFLLIVYIIDKFNTMEVIAMDKHDLTFEELVDILKSGQTWSEIKDALASQEITEEEYKTVLAFVKEKDPEKAEELFKEILQNIKAQPTFDTHEDLEQWASYRESVAADIADLKQLELDYEREKRVLESEVADLENRISKMQERHEDTTALLKNLNVERAQLDYATQRLAVTTKQIMALSLIEAHAKSPEQQHENFEKAKNRVPLINTLKRAWELHREHARNLRSVLRETRDISKPDKAMDKLNKSRLKYTKSQVKEFNKLKSTIQKEEAKLMKAAAKITAKEFRQYQHMNRLEHWCKGVPLDRESKPIEIKDLETAKAVIEGATIQVSPWQQASIESAQKNLEMMQERMREAEANAIQCLGEIAQVLRDRKANVIKTIGHVVEAERSGELGHISDKTMRSIEKDFQEAMEYTQIDPSLLAGSMFTKDLDMAGFMQDHGFGDLIGGDHDSPDHDDGPGHDR
jgi:hypothetical protein